MHRSGTSLVSQLFHRAGFDFGSSKLLYPADRWNMQGYVETAPIMDLNSIFITGIPRTKSRIHAFLSQCIYMSMPDPRRIYRRGLKHQRDIRQTGRIYDKLAVKDPRFCLTLPLWELYANIDKVVVCIRHPEQVARSLSHRQAVPRTMAFKFWRYHIRSLLDNAPRGRTYFFDVDKLFTGEGLKTLSGALRFLEANETDAGKILGDVFNRGLMHNNVSQNLALPDATEGLWERLGDAASRVNQPYQ